MHVVVYVCDILGGILGGGLVWAEWELAAFLGHLLEWRALTGRVSEISIVGQSVLFGEQCFVELLEGWSLGGAGINVISRTE